MLRTFHEPWRTVGSLPATTYQRSVLPVSNATTKSSGTVSRESQSRGRAGKGVPLPPKVMLAEYCDQSGRSAMQWLRWIEEFETHPNIEMVGYTVIARSIPTGPEGL